MSVAERIKNRRIELGISVDDIAEALGVNRTTVYRYESKDIEKMPITVIEPLASVLKVTPEYLMGWTDDEPDLSKYGLTPVTTHKVPLLGSVACGKPVFADQDLETYVDPREVGADFALRCKGDSMIDAGLHDGDIAFIRKQSDLHSGEIGVVLVNDEATLKKIYKFSDHIELRAANENFPTIFLREEDGSVSILGKLVGFYHEVKEQQS